MWNIAHEDNIRYLKSLPDGNTDLVLTSPPYDIGKSYEGGTLKKGGQVGGSRVDPRGKIKSNADYVSGLKPAMKEIVRILKPGGSLGWQTGYRYDKSARRAASVPIDMITVPAFLELGMIFHQRIVWICTRRFPAQYRLCQRHEILSWLVKPDGKATTNIKDIPDMGQRWDGKPYSKPSDVWEIASVRGKRRTELDHDALMPLFLAKRFVLLTTNPGDNVVDPWMGTATTLVAAAILNRAGFGCDKEKRHTLKSLQQLHTADAAYTAYGEVCKDCGGTGIVEGIGGRSVLCDCTGATD